ncbi:MAG: TIGR04211 family SH3 domain-containing protein [Gammaproteobacteria bacterium]|nr:MAG: TIGR04211 family SH3 domain-containing protein [Gammaproteobacteria bacterium]
MKSKSCLAALLIVAGFTLSARAETVYISDTFAVPLRSGPSNSHRILHRGLPSGTELTVLERDDEGQFARVRTTRGTEGWIPQQYLVAEPIARDRLDEASREIERLSGLVEEREAEIAQLRQAGARTWEEIEAGAQPGIRGPAGASAASPDERRLMELNERLRHEFERLAAERDELKSSARQRWLLIGAGIMLAGIAIGAILKARPRRSAWS